jgi:hypothetical protein
MMELIVYHSVLLVIMVMMDYAVDVIFHAKLAMAH